MTFRFLRKRWSSGSSEKFQYELDKSKSNKTVLKIEDKQTVTYNVNSGAANSTPGLAKANHPLSSSVPLSYFEVFILNGGKEGTTTSTIAVGLATHDYSTDLFPGWIRGSYGYHGDDGRKYSGLPGGTGESYGPTFGPGDVIGVGLDNASNNIFFTKNGRYLGPAFKRTGVADLYPCVGLSTPGETACVNFVPPFVFDHVAAQLNGVGVNPSSLEEVNKGRGYEDLHWDPARCGKSLDLVGKTRAQVVSDAPHSAIGVVQCSLPFSPYHAETFSYFEVLIERLEKGHVSIGLSNHEYPLNLHIGWLRRSYGYHSDDGRKFKWKEHESGTNDGELYGPAFGQGDVIGCGLNLQTRELYFTKNGTMLGVAFTNVYGILYPSVALTGPGDSMTANFYPPFKCPMFTNSLVNVSTGSTVSSSSSTIAPPAPPPLPGHAQLSVSAPTIRNTSHPGSGASPTISESPPRAHSFLHNHSSTNTYPSHMSRSPQAPHGLATTSLTSMGSVSSVSSAIQCPPSQTSPAPSALGSSPSSRSNPNLMNSKSTPALSSNNPNPITISATLSTLPRPGGQKQGTGNSSEFQPFNILPNSNLGLSGAQLSSTTNSSTPSPPISPRTLSASNGSSVSDEVHLNPGPTPAPTPVIAQPSLSSSGGSMTNTGNGWKKSGKSIKLKDEITATLAKKKTALVQGGNKWSAAQRLWYFEVYIEGMDKRASVFVGLTSEDYSTSKHIGKEPKSFGYSSEDGRRYRNDSGEPYGTPFGSTEVVGCGFNTVTREIFFTKNGTYLGVAFWDIAEIPLYPSVSLRGVVGLTCVAQFHPPFKFDLHSLPDISPSMWSESLGDPALSDEQVLYPPSSSSNRLLPWESSAGSGGREARGLHLWPANDVAIWLESIGYGQYRKEFYNNNISGRHLHSLNHQLLKNEIGIESYGHRADILDRVNKLLNTWKEKVGTEDSSLMDSTDAGSAGSDFDYPQDSHANGANLLHDSHNITEEVLQPFRPPLLHHPQAVHRFSDHENSEDEGRGARGKRNNTTSQGHPHPAHITTHANTIANLHNLSNTSTNITNANINPALASLVSTNANDKDKDAKWRRRTVPGPDGDDIRVTAPPNTLTTTTTTTTTHTHHTPAQLNHRPGNRPRTNTGNLPLPNGLPHFDSDLQHDPTGHNHKPRPMPFQNHSQLASTNLSSSPPVIHTSPQPLIHTSPISHMSNSLTSLPTFISSPANPLIPSPIALSHSSSATGITQNTPPKRSGSPLARSLITPPPQNSSTTSTPITSPEPTSNTPHSMTPQTSTPGQLVVSPTSGLGASPTKTSGELHAEPHEWEIDFSELELGAVIGKGFFGEVKRGSWRETDVAIKIIYRDSFKSKTSFDMFMNEVSILSKLRHPCVVQFLGACTTGDTHCIVTEWMVGGSLRQFLNSHFSAITPLVRIKIGLDIAKGMNYLHGWTPPILHRDLSTRNILLDVDGVWSSTLSSSLSSSNLSISSPAPPVRPSSVRCKVADFGLSRLKLEHGVMTASVGCIPYMAPEVYKGEANSEKSDVYSYGMILWEVLTGEEPQQDMKPLKMAHLAAHEGYRPPLSMSTPPAWRSLITSLWAADPEVRPSFKRIIISLKEMEEREKASIAAMRLNASTLSSSSSVSSTPFTLPSLSSLSISSSTPSVNSSTASLSFSTPTPPPSIPSPRNIGEYTD